MLDHHPFRQTQTAITIEYMARDGIEWVRYPLPVFGPPWTAPLEFPIYQATAAMLVRAGVGPVEFAGRVVNLAFFYLSAAALFGLCRTGGFSRPCAAVAVVVYLWMPFNIFWSRTVLIEYTAVAFALTYAWAMLALVDRRRAWVWLPAALAAGSLGYVTKVTTMLPATTLVALPLVAAWWRDWRDSRMARWPRWSLVGVAIAVPLAVGVTWARVSDAIRSASPFTEHLSIQNLRAWNFGTIEQRLSGDFWATMEHRVFNEMLSEGAYIALPFLVWMLLRMDWAQRRLVIGAMLAPLAAILVFTNLHAAHNYYQAAFAAMLAIVAAPALVAMGRLLPQRPRLIIACALGMYLLSGSAMWYLHIRRPSPYGAWVTGFAQRVAEVTPPDEWIIINERDWSPTWLYYTHRRGFFYLPTRHPADTIERIKDDGPYRTFVTLTKDDPLLANWRHHELEFELGRRYVYRVSDPAPPEPDPDE